MSKSKKLESIKLLSKTQINEQLVKKKSNL